MHRALENLDLNTKAEKNPEKFPYCVDTEVYKEIIDDLVEKRGLMEYLEAKP